MKQMDKRDIEHLLGKGGVLNRDDKEEADKIGGLGSRDSRRGNLVDFRGVVTEKRLSSNLADVPSKLEGEVTEGKDEEKEKRREKKEKKKHKKEKKKHKKEKKSKKKRSDTPSEDDERKKRRRRHDTPEK